jgi:hypothetical protein
MKIEPRKTAALPKYAMLLAASATLLTGCAPDLAGDTTIAPDQRIIDNSENDPVQLEGEAVSLTDVVADQSAESLPAGFARQGITLERTYEASDYAGNCQQTWYVDRDNAVSVCFYYDCLGDGQCDTENGAQQFDWGYADQTLYPLGQAEQTACRTAFIAVSMDRTGAITEDEAEQIAKDLLGDTAGETEVQEDEN